jgi:hypothetical protein
MGIFVSPESTGQTAIMVLMIWCRNIDIQNIEDKIDVTLPQCTRQTSLQAVFCNHMALTMVDKTKLTKTANQLQHIHLCKLHFDLTLSGCCLWKENTHNY